MTLAPVRLADVLRSARARGASDVHLGGGERPVLRIDGRLTTLDVAPLDHDGLRAFVAAIFTRDQLARLDDAGCGDGAAARGSDCAPYRVHAFRCASGLHVAIRLLAASVPAFESLGLPPTLAGLAQRSSGLVLVTGPTGSGKTTALAALIDRINRTCERTVVTIEDPVEYAHASMRSLIVQCEVGRDVTDHAHALRGALRADPDVIVIGEMRDRETFAAALTAAETGHLVLATLHTNDAAQTVDRIVDAFPADGQAQVRGQLASVIAGVASLRLVPRRDAAGRRAAAEVLTATDAVRALVREGKTHHLRNAIVTGRAAGMQTLESHLSDLVVRGDVALADARAAAVRPEEVRALARAAS